MEYPNISIRTSAESTPGMVPRNGLAILNLKIVFGSVNPLRWACLMTTLYVPLSNLGIDTDVPVVVTDLTRILPR